ncbi:helix-turn-helix domain-containing protein [Yinghuangia sp. YIM S09857]|uniref:helix-turn-helix domain-containing protein n=1 Tax=Yinghuangia sp. YIM S09857 TaxID=3436929 RepID=UPI003F53BA86
MGHERDFAGERADAGVGAPPDAACARGVSLAGPPVAAALRPLIRSIGYAESWSGHGAEVVLPHGGPQMLVNMHCDRLGSGPPAEPGAERQTRGAALQGPSTGPVVVDPSQQRAVVWVAFHTAGAHPLFGVPLSAARDRLVGLDDLWGTDGAVLRERLLEANAVGGPQACLRALEAALLARVEAGAGPDPAVRAAAARLDRGASVREAADQLGWTPRRLTARFDVQMGLSPKRYARVRRFQHLLARVNADPRNPDWAALAAEGGYHDQAHLIHEFRDLAGMTPTAYVPRSATEPNHVPLDG